MAQIKIIAVNKRQVTMDVKWDGGYSKNGMIAYDVPVEDFEKARLYLTAFVESSYPSVVAAAEAVIYANPTPDPMVTAAIGHTFDDLGNIIA